MELTVDDPAYIAQLADNRKFEIREWLLRRYANSLIGRQEFDKKMRLLDHELSHKTPAEAEQMRFDMGFKYPEEIFAEKNAIEDNPFMSALNRDMAARRNVQKW